MVSSCRLAVSPGHMRGAYEADVSEAISVVLLDDFTIIHERAFPMLDLHPNILLGYIHQHQRARWDEAKQMEQARQLKAMKRRPRQPLAYFLSCLHPWRKPQPKPHDPEALEARVHTHQQAA